jgi:enamine deaminase RidA (YjgF/YER057c/UK114 family)
MNKTLIYPKGHPPSRGAYSPGIRIDLGGASLLFITGQLALDAENNVVAPHDAAAQTEAIFLRIGAILEAARMNFGDGVKVDTFLTEMKDFEKFSAVRNRYFSDTRPVSTLLEVKGLAKPGLCVEIEVTAVKESGA